MARSSDAYLHKLLADPKIWNALVAREKNQDPPISPLDGVSDEDRPKLVALYRALRCPKCLGAGCPACNNTGRT
jgi:hypothetical protein